MDKVSNKVIALRINRSDAGAPAPSSRQPNIKARDKKQVRLQARAELADGILKAASKRNAGVQIIARLAESGLKESDQEKALLAAWQRAFDAKDQKQICVIAAVVFKESPELSLHLFVELHSKLGQWSPVDAAVLAAKIEHLRSAQGGLARLQTSYVLIRNRLAKSAVESVRTASDLDTLLAKLTHGAFATAVNNGLHQLIWITVSTPDTDLTLHAISRLLERVPVNDAVTRNSLAPLINNLGNMDAEKALSFLESMAKIADGNHGLLATRLRDGKAALISQIPAQRHEEYRSSFSPSE